MGHQPLHAPHFRQVHHVEAGCNGATHGEHELEQVGPQDGPQPTISAEEQGDAARYGEGHPAWPTEQDAAEFDGGQAHRGHDEHIEHKSEVDGAEAPEEGASPSTVSQLVELNVGEDAGASPELGVHENGHHPRQQEGPPGPIARYALLANEVCDEVGRVSTEGRGDHRRAEQPPRHRASAKKIVVCVAAPLAA